MSKQEAESPVEPDALAPIFRPCMFWTPEREAPSAWIEHVPFAFWLTDVLRPRRFVELGTHQGVSYSAVCQTIRSLGLATSCFAIDTWKGDEHAGFYPEDVYRDFAAFNDRKYGAFSQLLRSRFDEALPYFEDGSIDLLHIDGLHTYEAVRRDFESWHPKLSSDAVVLLHDTNVRGIGFGVFRLWSEIAEGRPHFAFLHGYGLGVLGLGHHYPDALSTLFRANSDRMLAGAIQGVFASLGRAQRVSYELRRLERALSEQAAEVEALRRTVAAHERKLATSTKSLADYEAALERSHIERGSEKGSLLASLATRDAQIEALHATIEKLHLSASWRITAPLRAAAYQWRQIRHNLFRTSSR